MSTKTPTPTAPAAVDPRVSLTFARKGRETSHWLEGEFPVDARPDALFDAFVEAGWTLDPVVESVPSYEAYTMDETRPLGQQMVNLGYQIKEFALTKPGTGLFTGWTDAEKRTNLREARAILRRFGFTWVPVWSKTLADLL